VIKNKWLLGTKAPLNINFQDEDGFTALMRAAQGAKNDPKIQKNKIEILKMLLLYQAKIDLKDNVMKFTALQWAKELDNKEAVELLIEAGAKEYNV